MKLKEIHRTSTFSWSPFAGLPSIATGTVAGALDASFSNDSQLEIWNPDFLNKTEVQLGLDDSVPSGAVTTSSRFNRLAWSSYRDDSRPKGVLAAGMENGELVLWDPSEILASSDATKSLILRNTTHTGPVRALDFNPLQTNLLSSGATNGEIYIWDLKDPTKPYSPGNRSSKLDEITALAWNARVPHVLGTSSSTGYTVVWDLRGKKEVVSLAYGGGAGTGGGPAGGPLAMSGRRGMSDVAWHPDNATRLVTASEDDSSPIIMVWDLRNARAPEKILTGHEKGVLSLSWCRQDADLLLSCGKDNRALCWNPQTSELIGELPPANNWAFQVQWCPRNPDLLATAYFDGTIGVHSLQSTNESTTGNDATAAVTSPKPDGADIFDTSNFGGSSQLGFSQPTLSLKQPPKWLRRPTSSTFGFGGQLVTVSNLPGAGGVHQSHAVRIAKVVAEPSIVERANKLREAEETNQLSQFAQEKTTGSANGAATSKLESWKALLSLFNTNSRDELVTLLGFSKEEVEGQVAEAIKNIKASSGTSVISTSAGVMGGSTEPEEADVTDGRSEPVVSFVEPESEQVPLTEPTEGPPGDGNVVQSEPTPSEVSASATSDITKGPDGESTTTEASLFGDEIGIGTPLGENGADFFSTMGGGVAAAEQGVGAAGGPGGVGVRFNALPQHVLVPHHSYAADSSVAATVGSRPSSAASDSALKSNTFKIYPNEESDVDRLVTQALVLGDFQSAVELCLSAERYADAILLAVKGGEELLKRTQEKYFEKRTEELPYLRLYQSIVTDDLADVVQNAELREWQEIFVILCTFARGDEFSNLAKQLGQRLEFQGKVVKAAAGSGNLESARAWRRNAVLCYLAAGKLEQVVSIWVEEMKEEEEDIAGQGEAEGNSTGSRYTAHASALQTFIEKITVFRAATSYSDPDLSSASTASDSGVTRSYKLAGLYDRYFEYADLLAAQGLLKDAVRFIGLTPADYKGSKGGVVDVSGGGAGGEVDFEVARNRVLLAAGIAIAAGSQSAAKGSIKPNVPAVTTVPARSNQYQHTVVPQTTSAYGPYGVAPAPVSQVAPPAPTQLQKPSPYQTAYAPTNGSTAPVHDPYAPVGGAASQAAPPQPQQPAYRPQGTPYGAPNTYGGYGGGPSTYGQAQPAYGQASIPPPAPVAPPLRAPPKRTDQGWNDAPPLDTTRKSTPSIPTSGSTPAPIVSPFPNTQQSGNVPMSPSSPYGGQGSQLPPPPRAGSAFGNQQGVHPPPPRGGSAMGSQVPPPPPANRGPPPPGVMGRMPPPGQGGPPQFNRPNSTGPGGPGPTFPVRSMSPLSRAGGGYGPPPGGQGMPPQNPPYRTGPGGPPPPPPGQHPRGPSGGPPPGPQMRGPGPVASPPVRGPGPYATPGAGQPQHMQPQQQQMPPQGGPYQGPGPVQQAYAPPPGGMSRPPPPSGPPQAQAPMGGPPPPPPHMQSPSGSSTSRPAPAGPPPPKYPAGDRSHIPDAVKPAYVVLFDALTRLKQTTPPQQKRMADDTERRLGALFDALNCETLSQGVQDQLLGLTAAMARGDQQGALAMHVDLLTKGSRTDDIGLWMAGIKLLIMRM